MLGISKMKSREWTICCLLILVNLVEFSLPMSLLKAQPDDLKEENDYYNPEENLGSTLFLAEGDILIDPKRSIDSAYHLMWLNRSVPYEFDKNFGPKQRETVEKAMAVLENLSCIRFRQRWNEADYVHIRVPNLRGCFSEVGRNGGQQDIGLSRECNFGSVIHELLHALGMWHEHNRRDRDDYITVIWDNIKNNKQENFYKLKDQSNQNVVLKKPYDYGSIMHYSNTTFRKYGQKPTLQAKKPLPPGVKMGQRAWPSKLDMEKLKALYMCDVEVCPSPDKIANGNFHGQTFSVGSTVTYSCLPGHILIGAAERMCLTIGQWSGNRPACLPNTTRDPLRYCNFDEPYQSLCGWTQAVDDGLDWTFNSGATPTVGTGPNWDNTFNTPSGVYLYVEASGSGGSSSGKRARLLSPVLKGNIHNDLCLVFFTHMYGRYMGSLSVYKETEGITSSTNASTVAHKKEILFTLKGDQGMKWRQIFLVLGKISQPFRIILEGSIYGYSSDIAVDDLTIGSCNEFKPLALSGGLEHSLSCSFDDGHICRFIQDNQDSADWFVNSGGTPTFNTGPDCDPVNCSSGSYLYLETSDPQRSGNTARLKTPVIGSEGQACMSFYYHMYGDHVGSLHIKMVSAISGHQRTLYLKSGSQGDRWFLKSIQYNALEAYKILIEGTVGAGYRGDIAIDNIDITSGACSGLIKFNCNFEHGLCGWTNILPPGDTKDWTRHVGETDTPATGPVADRTNPDGHYLYVESSRSGSYDSARLTSPTIRQTHEGFCLKFWYHMYGQKSGNMTVYVQSEIGQEDAAWTRSGNQGNHWIFQQLHLTSFPTQSINVIFEVKLNGYTGDTAIDDVSIHTGSCEASNE